jgi:hypothetical protein
MDLTNQLQIMDLINQLPIQVSTKLVQILTNHNHNQQIMLVVVVAIHF